MVRRIAYSKGGTFIVAGNIQLLCARHNNGKGWTNTMRSFSNSSRKSEQPQN
jgi:hypothetical protein